MKIYLFIVVGGLTLCSLGFVDYWRARSAKTEQSQRLEIAELQKEFVKKHTAELVVDLSDARYRKELLNPEFATPQSQKYPYEQIAPLYQYSQTCGPAQNL